MNQEEQASVPRSAIVGSIGRRNIGYVAFVASLIPLALLLEENGPSGPDAGGGIMFGLIVWALVSVAFFVINLILLIRDLARQRPVAKALIACTLPILAIVGTLVVEDIAMRWSHGDSAAPAVLDEESPEG
jgi:uncharacterized membrane protein YhaH (DUF805 family)